MEKMLWPGKHEVVDHLRIHHGLNVWDALAAADRHLYEHTSSGIEPNHEHVDELVVEEPEEEPVFATAIGASFNAEALFIYAMDPLSVRIRFQAIAEAISVWGLGDKAPTNVELLQTASAIEQYINRGRVPSE